MTLTPRDFTAEVIGYLSALLAAPVSTSPAEDGPSLVVDVLNVTRSNRVTDVALVALQGYASGRDGRALAHDLTAEAWTRLLDADESPASPWRSVRPQGGPVVFPDDDRPGTWRFQASALVSARGR